MLNQMFCFQCEQTAKGTGCTAAAGVCGKKAATAGLQDKLTGLLIGLANAEGIERMFTRAELFSEGLFLTLTNVNFDDNSINAFIERINREASEANVTVKPYPLELVWTAHPDVRSLKSLILLGLRGMAAYAYQAAALGYRNATVEAYMEDALAAVGQSLDPGTLLETVLGVGKANLDCMALLDQANIETFGPPTPTQVSMKVEKGPFIVVTGHDLLDLKLLLEQTKDKGVNIYTHGEMLPCHAYPELKKYSHLKGNYGTAWQNQRKEFADLPAPILFTTNCLMPPTTYTDKVFTTGPVSFAGAVHIDEHKDFSPLIEKALELGGFNEDRQFAGINGGTQLTVGFAKDTVIAVAPAVIEAVKAGKISHFFLVGGCDGAKPGRSYYTEFAEKTPQDSVILTLACGKYRFNDIDFGMIGNLPRLMDMGQCNDAYSAIKVAQALAEAFGVGINELPLSLVLSWYEQKAVCILLTLLHLGFKNILLGPSLPAFVSPGVLKVLVDSYGIAPISDPDSDLAKLLNK